jgi:hypothetical protein
MEEDDEFKAQVQKDKDELDAAKKLDSSQKQQSKQPKQQKQEAPAAPAAKPAVPAAKPAAPAAKPAVLSEKDQLKNALKALGKETLELYDADTYPYSKANARYKKDEKYKENADKYDSDAAYKQKIDDLVGPQKAARAAVVNVFKSGEKYPDYYVKAEDDGTTAGKALKATNIAKREAIVREAIAEMKKQKGGNFLRKYF